jgi:predicted helicase
MYLIYMAKVYHNQIFGLRESKYDWLDKHDIKNVKWNKLDPNSEFYLFIPQDVRLQKNYESFSKITEIFPANNVGVVTARDSFVIDTDKKQLEKRIRQFVDPKVDDEIIKQTYGLGENKGWKIRERRKNLRKDDDWQNRFTQILYRPFDIQWIFYHDELIERGEKK